MGYRIKGGRLYGRRRGRSNQRARRAPGVAAFSDPRRCARLAAKPPPQTRHARAPRRRSEEHTSEIQSPCNLVCRLLLEKKKNKHYVYLPVAVPPQAHHVPTPLRDFTLLPTHLSAQPWNQQICPPPSHPRPPLPIPLSHA